jgi:dihydrofolate synthase/folylpolyglutamate synthase
MHETVEWLYGLQHFGMKLGLDNIRALLERLDHPEHAYRTVHVAGTNGKGSVGAMLDSMLRASDVPSGLFTSPHLMHPNERIRIAGDDIAAEELHRRLAGMRDVIERGVVHGALAAHPSFFEVITATALTAFRDHALGAAVLEVGLGGRLDATNAVEADIGVIVSIAHDHTKTLGPTLRKIAGEKAGIIKPGMPLVCGVTQQSAVEVIRAMCVERGARLIDARQAVRFEREDSSGLTLRTARQTYTTLRPALPGRHQIDNARVALAAFELVMERLGRDPQPEAVRQGLANVRWAGRLQRIVPADGPPDLLFDAAHNPAGVEALVRHLHRAGSPRPVLLFGATSGKPLERLLGPLAEVVDGAVITRPNVERGLDPEEVAVVARRWIHTVETEVDHTRAVARARSLAGVGRYVLVTGSLYLVGQIMGLLTAESIPGPVAM